MYTRKRASCANRTKHSEARVMDNMEMVRLKKEDAAKEGVKLKKAQAKATRAQAKANKAVQGGTGQGTGQGGQGGWSGGSPPAKVCLGK